MSEKSDQPTEEPTARRLAKALEDGQIAFSTELIGGLVVLVAVLFFFGMGRWFFEAIMTSLRERLTFFDSMIQSPENILLAMRRGMTEMGMACLGLMIPLMLIIVLSGTLQTRFNISMKPMEWKLDKMSPMKGFKRIFSTRALMKGFVSISKATAIIVSAWIISIARMKQLALSGTGTYGDMINTGSDLILTIGFSTAFLLIFIGAIDLGFQIWKQNKDLMMTRQEVNEEGKESEGDPMIKARIRKLQSEMAKKRVIQEVPNASVIITNPTHFAVALRYEQGETSAPVVIAKGSDYLAKQIIRVAREHGIAVVERKPVARFLYAHTKVGQEIPQQLFGVVAEILNFVNSTKRAA